MRTAHRAADRTIRDLSGALSAVRRLQPYVRRASVTWLFTDKGFGFILAGDGNEYFFHQSACTQTPFDSLREGQAVTFDQGQGPKGPRGENVRLV